MALPGNGTTKRIIAGVVTAIIIGLATQVYVNTNRITAVEVEIKGIRDAITLNRSELQTNRAENRDEHKEIMAAIKEVKK
jgi:hypothetical protein